MPGRREKSKRKSSDPCDNSTLAIVGQAWFDGSVCPRTQSSGLDAAMFDRILNSDAAVGRLMRFLAVQGITGQEEAIGKEVVRELTASGVPRSRIRFDR